MHHFFYVYPVNEVVVLIIDKDVTENQHTVNLHTQKGICGTVLIVQYLPSGEHQNYDHVLNSNSTNTKQISGE